MDCPTILTEADFFPVGHSLTLKTFSGIGRPGMTSLLPIFTKDAIVSNVEAPLRAWRRMGMIRSHLYAHHNHQLGKEHPQAHRDQRCPQIEHMKWPMVDIISLSHGSAT